MNLVASGGPVDSPSAEASTAATRLPRTAVATQPAPSTATPASAKVPPQSGRQRRAKPEPARGLRRLPEWPILVVLTGVLVGLIVVGAHHFRRGTMIISLSVLLAAGLRAFLSPKEAGVLAVRSRVVDVITLAALGLILVTLTVVIPPPN
ncbi:hypothetical protein C3Y87_02960 [Carbonactinospora thermoautotrophica]|nr:hypothetical protein [Carbonactinospora thermoautotrophica]